MFVTVSSSMGTTYTHGLTALQFIGKQMLNKQVAAKTTETFPGGATSQHTYDDVFYSGT